MADVATLGIQVEARGVEQGAKALDALTNSAKMAEAATSGITTVTTSASAATEKVSATATNAARALEIEARSAQNAARALQMHGNAAGRSAANVGNLASQFQDIGVTLAMGMSPLQIALQQGTQIAAVLGPMGAAGAVRGLGAAFLSVISPVSLVTIGLIAAGAAAVQYFMSWMSDGESANTTLAEQGKLIQGVATEWGNATPKLKAYADELERVKAASDLRNVAEIAAKAQIAPIEDTLSIINQQYTAAIRNLRSYGDDTNAVVSSLTSAFSNLQSKILEGKATTEDLTTVQNAMAAAVKDFGTPAVLQLSAAFEQLVPRINAAIAAAGGFRAEASSALSEQLFQKNLGNSTLPSLDPLGFINADRDQTNRANATQSQYQIAAAAAAKAAASAPKASEYENATRSIKEQTAALQAQNAVQAGLNPLVNDYGFALAKAKASADLLAAAERDKKAITPQLTADINAQATALANATVEQAKLAEATKNAQANLEFVRSSATGFLSTMRQGLVSGEGWWKSFGNAALSVLDKIAGAIETKLVDALLGVNGSGFNILSLFGLGGATAGGLSGTNVGGVGAGAASAPVAKMAARMPAPRPAPQAANINDPVVHVVVDDEGGLRAYVQKENRKSEVRMAKSAQAGLDAHRKGTQKQDILRTVRSPRRVGNI